MLGYLKARSSKLWSYLAPLLILLLSYRVVRWPLTFLDRVWSFRVLRWPVKVLFWTSVASNVLEMSIEGMEAFGIIDVDAVDNFIEYLLPSSDSAPDFSATNPFRELPNDPAVLAAIKESTLLTQVVVQHPLLNSRHQRLTIT